MLERRPPWGAGFIDFSASNTTTPIALGSLFDHLSAHHISISPKAQADLVSSISRQAGWDAGWSYYQPFHPKADLRNSLDPAFAQHGDNRSMFDWNLLPVDGTNNYFDLESNSSGGFVYSAPTSIGGSVLRQVQMLPAGSYMLEGHGTAHAQTSDIGQAPYWDVKCTISPTLARVSV